MEVRGAREVMMGRGLSSEVMVLVLGLVGRRRRDEIPTAGRVALLSSGLGSS